MRPAAEPEEYSPARPASARPTVDFDALEAHLAMLLERHDRAREATRWDYAELVDALQARRLDGLLHRLGDGPVDPAALRAAWAGGAGPIAPAHARALETAYLGEVNLPWYAENLSRHLETGHRLLGSFFRRWVAEEDQHGRAFEIYLLLDRAVPADGMLAAKGEMLRVGRTAPATDPFRIMVYTSIQELSTRVFYARLADAVGESDPLLVALLRRVQADESLHLAFYRDAVRLSLEQRRDLEPVVLDELTRFREPVTVLPDYEQRKAQIWHAGLSSLGAFGEQVVAPLLRYWRIDDIAALRRWTPRPPG
jgi:acyl-[acyl-carrier-protein] desaturase